MTMASSFHSVVWYDTSTLVLALLALPIIAFVAFGTYNAFFHPLAKVPGPRLYAATNLPYLRHLLKGRWPFILKQLHDKYGPVVRFTPNDVSFISPSAWRTIYGHKKPGQLSFDKDKRFYRPSMTSTPSILLANDADHARHRRLLSHAFSEKALRGQEDIMDHYISLLIRKIKPQASAGMSVDLTRWYNFTTFDIVGDLSFGESFGCLESGGYHPWVAMIFDGFKLSVFMQTMRRAPWSAPFLGPMIPKKLIKGSKEHLSLSFEKAKKRVESGRTDREDFMSYILRHNDEKGMNADEIGENANILIIAGSETTATTLMGATFWLLKTPLVYKKLVQEIRSTFPKEEDIKTTSVNNCQYLIAVLNEALRKYPPVPGGLGRLTPHGGSMIDEYWIPEGTVVSVSHWSSYHSARNFAYPEEFLPERWLDDPRFANDVKDVMQPFSFGPRNCLGKNLAYAEMRLIIARMLRNFDLELMPDSQDWNKQRVLNFWDKGPMNVRLKLVQRG